MNSSLDPDRYRRLRALFDAVLEIEPAEQRAYLEAHCDDAELRAEVERLLVADAREHELFGASSMKSERTAAMPERIGRYRIVDRLGEGGMGSVYRAEQDHPRRTVALKVMHLGLFSPSMLRRFEYEGEVLAQLSHPGIAHVYEAGTAEIGTTVLPYFAMELVQGISITAFADERRLSLRARLELVARVADAIEHAHQIGVIHRDLKPENILVDASGQPKILDFGIARATRIEEGSSLARTQSGLLVGTLGYMSPEQASGDSRALDTRSDVYALGVLTYELVTGRPPHDLSNASIARAAKIITEEEPARPSVFDRRLRGDVDTIVLKALEKDKERRYASAAALALDLRAYLKDEPIAARRATTLYQAAKFTRRHTGLVVGLVATFLALVVGLVVSLSYYASSERARVAAEESGAAQIRERQRAERSAQRADSINHFVLREMFAAPDPWTPSGKDVSVASVLDRIADRVSTSFAGDPELEADAQATLAGSYLARGMFERGAQHAERALELRRRLHTTDDPDLAASLLTYARARSELGDLPTAEANAKQALEMFERLHDAPRESIADATRELARVRLSKGEREEALSGFQRVLEIQRELHGDEDPTIAQALSDLLAVRTSMGDLVEAERLAREVLALRKRLHTDDSPYVALSLNDLAAILFEKRDAALDGEIAMLQKEAAEILERQLGPEHRLTLLARRTYANVLVRLEQFDEAEKTLRKVAEALPRVIGVDHADNVETLNSYGYLLFLMDRFDEAEVQYHKAIEISERVFGPEHDNTLRPILNLAFVEKSRGLANAHDADGDGKIDVAPDSDLARAELHFRRAYSGFKKLYGELHPNTAPILYSLGEMLYRVGNYAEAARILRQYAEAMLQRKEPGYEEDVTHVLMLQGIAAMRAGSLADGESALRDCVERCRAVFPEGDWRTAVCASAWGECLTKLGKHSDAEAQLKASFAVLESQRDARKRDYADVVRRLAELYESEGQSDRAREWREKL